jgi:hypothetical protein
MTILNRDGSRHFTFTLPDAATPQNFETGTIWNAGHRPGSNGLRLQLAGTVPGAPFRPRTMPLQIFSNRSAPDTSPPGQLKNHPGGGEIGR